MLNNIRNNEDVLVSNSIAQQAKIGSVEKKTAAQNPYLKVAEFADVIDISEQAKKLYEKEKEIEKYKSIVLDMLNAPGDTDETNAIVDSLKTEDYVSNDAIADKMVKDGKTLNGSDLLKILFSDSDTQAASSFKDLLGDE